MADSTTSTYYPASKGSISGFEQITLPSGQFNPLTEGWSIDALQRYLTNQGGANFLSADELLRIQDLITAHEEDYNNPHRTTLSQIVGDIVGQAVGAIVPGTPPSLPPFFSIDAATELPFTTILTADLSAVNLYRMTSGGTLRDISTDVGVMGTDYILGRAGIPLYSSITNIVAATWATDTATRLNTTLSSSTDTSLSYPFTFYDVKETPATAIFGVDIPMTQDLQTNYSATFFIVPSSLVGSVRIYQPTNASSFITVSLSDGAVDTTSTDMVGYAYRYSNGVIRVSVNFTSLNPTPDNKLRVVHLGEGESNPSRQGLLDRKIFSIGYPQASTAAPNFPVVKNGTQIASTSAITANLTEVGAPNQLTHLTLTTAFSVFPTKSLANVLDGTILSIGDLIITRDQTTIRVAVAGSVLFTTPILEGYNAVSISYSPTEIIFKDLANGRQAAMGTYGALATTNLTVGPMGGYLHALHLYAQSDDNQVLEYLNNG